MAIKTIRVSDETMAKYQDMHPQNPTLAIENQLEKFRDVSYKERVLLFDSTTRKDLEHLVGRPIEDAYDFVQWVRKLMVFNLEGVEIALTDGQRKRLEGEAKFYGQPLETYIRMRVQSAVQGGLGV